MRLHRPHEGRPEPRLPHAAIYCKTLYKQRHRSDYAFAKLKDWRRLATRHDRCAYAFFSAICIATTFIF
jgi:transposase